MNQSLQPFRLRRAKYLPVETWTSGILDHVGFSSCSSSIWLCPRFQPVAYILGRMHLGSGSPDFRTGIGFGGWQTVFGRDSIQVMVCSF
jgi:hypothetical protein